MMKTKQNNGLDWLWEVRRRIARKFDGDPHKQADHLRHRQQKEKRRIYQRMDEVVAVK